MKRKWDHYLFTKSSLVFQLSRKIVFHRLTFFFVASICCCSFATLYLKKTFVSHFLEVAVSVEQLKWNIVLLFFLNRSSRSLSVRASPVSINLYCAMGDYWAPPEHLRLVRAFLRMLYVCSIRHSSTWADTIVSRWERTNTRTGWRTAVTWRRHRSFFGARLLPCCRLQSKGNGEKKSVVKYFAFNEQPAEWLNIWQLLLRRNVCIAKGKLFGAKNYRIFYEPTTGCINNWNMPW